MKKIVSILSIMIAAYGLSACNTMKGVGQDVQRGGEKIEGTAEKSQQQR